MAARNRVKAPLLSGQKEVATDPTPIGRAFLDPLVNNALYFEVASANANDWVALIA